MINKEELKNKIITIGDDEITLRDCLSNARKSLESFDDLIEFLEVIRDNCNTSYGNAPRAIAQAAAATAWRFSDIFGITSFQAGYVMWDFIKEWTYSHNKCGLKMVNYDDMLYPQYEHTFGKTISRNTFESLQKEAKEKLANDTFAHPDVLAHWRSIADGNVPFGYTVVDR